MDQRRADALVDLILGRSSITDNADGTDGNRRHWWWFHFAPTEVQVTVSAETLAGVSDEPGELAGYGPITASHARDLAHGDARWRRILFDHTTGRVLDVATRPAEPSYRPSATLSRTIPARDSTCRFPAAAAALLVLGSTWTTPLPGPKARPTPATSPHCAAPTTT